MGYTQLFPIFLLKKNTEKLNVNVYADILEILLVVIFLKQKVVKHVVLEKKLEY